MCRCEAGFKKFTADITFDPARPETGKSRIEIDMTVSISTTPEVNDEAKGKAWFDARSFPESKRSFRQASGHMGGGKYEARGSPETSRARRTKWSRPSPTKTRVAAAYSTAFVSDQAPAIQHRRRCVERHG
jgi:hypothetical protein